MNKNNKLILIITIISVSILIIIGATATFFGWKAEKEATIDVTIASGEGNCSLKRDNNIFIAPSTTKNGGRIIKLTAMQEMSTKAAITWNLNIKEISGLQDSSFKYEMINNSTGVSYGSGTFENITAGSTISFSNAEEALGFNLEYEFTLYLWIDGSIGNYQSSMADQTLDFGIVCNLVGTENGTINLPQLSAGDTAVDYINDLYYNSNPTLITQGNSGDQYYYSSAVNLMNDGLGEKEGNIRYYGADPNNYIYFNCDDYDNQTDSTCEKWRIIGVFDGKLKIVRQDSIGDYSWDYTSTGESDANWHDSTLMTLLNNGYYNGSDNVTYYNNSTTPITVNFNSSNIGLKTNESRELISESIWYLGAWDKGNIYPKTVSNYEHGYERCISCTGEPTWTGKIALPYASDYGFAADLRVCDQNMNHYDNENCINNNWMYKGTYLFYLTTHNEYTNYVWAQQPVGYTRTGSKAQYTRPTYPTLYLNADTKFNTTGDGTSNNPYQIALEQTEE